MTIQNHTKQIPLTQGKFALVDAEDYTWLSKWKWHFNKKGYARRTVCISYKEKKNKIISMHREIMQTPEGFDTDHINGDKLDNRRSNLRICTRSQNQRNRKPQKNKNTVHKGIYLNKKTGKWTSSITITLGVFDNEEDAARAYNTRIKEIYGEYAWLNDINKKALIHF